MVIASRWDEALEPLVPYPGSAEAPWKARWTTCETVLDPGPTLHNIRGALGSCPTCAARGINPARPGYLYLVVHDGHGALKWGIANIEHRLTQHLSQSCQLAARWDFDLTGDAWAFERQVKAWIRGQSIPRALSADQMKYGGVTETVFLADIALQLIRQYVTSLIDGSPETLPLRQELSLGQHRDRCRAVTPATRAGHGRQHAPRPGPLGRQAGTPGPCLRHHATR